MEAKYSSEKKAQDWLWLWSISAGSAQTAPTAREKASACRFLVFLNRFKLTLSLKAGKPQGQMAASFSVVLQVTFECPPFLCKGLVCSWLRVGCSLRGRPPGVQLPRADPRGEP